MKRTLRLVSAVFALCACLAIGTALSESALPTLSYGSTGDEVLALQARLTELGFYTFRITGNYQENTRAAVRAFQAAHGLDVTGIADATLQHLILSDLASPKPEPTDPPIDLTAPFTEKLAYGSTGENVRRVQARLKQLGYYNIEVSGQFLDNTREAVRSFQQKNALAVDGIVGQTTWQHLFFEAETVDASATPRPTPEPTPVPYYIEVDLTNQVTSVYGLDDYGAHTQLVRQMICSTGTDQDPTPVGGYILNGATSRWCYFPKWGTHAQYWTRIDAYNAFHSVIYSEPNTMALKTGSYTGLGKKASHGCIRLMVEDAKWIYEHCGKDTLVVVFDGEPDEELTMSLKIPPLDKSVMLPEPTAQPTAPPLYSADALPPLPFQALERGMESEDVYWLQCKLAELGYYQGTISGGYYQGTVDAVKAFQKDNGLTADGRANKNTLSKLYEDVINIPFPEPSAGPAATPAPAATTDPYDMPWFLPKEGSP